MSTPHLVECVCHGYMFWGRVHEGPQSVDNLQVGTSNIDLERIYESDFPNIPHPLTVSDAPTVIPASRPFHEPGLQLPLQCSCGLCGGLEVPQRPYQPVRVSPDLTYWDGDALSFSKGGCGISILDVLENHLSGLVGGDDLMFINAPVSTFSLRIEWPGYRLWTGKFRAKNWGGTNAPVTRARLVSQLGRRIAEFIEAMEGVECADLAWKVGSKNIKVDNLVLVSLIRVSKGSWQPVIRLLA